MVKKLLTSYTFTPGAANAGMVVVSGSYALEQFLLITNVTDGVTIFQFNKPSKGGAVSTGGGNTTLTLEADTSSMSAGDRLQVFVDDGQNAQVTLTNASVEISNDAGNAVPVSAASLPLPPGAATSANQTTANTSLANLDLDLGAQADAAATTDTGTFSVISLIKRGLQNWTTLLGRIPALDTGSVPVLVKNGQLEITNDTGNPLPVGPAAQLNVTGSASANNTDLISVACDSYRSVSFQITNTWSGTISYQVSNDNTNWVAANVIAANGTAAINSSTANTLAYGALVGFQYFRARFTAYTSGTASINAYFNRDPVPTATLPVSPTNTITASSTTPGGSAYTTNSTASTNAAVIKSTAGNLYSITAMNASAATKYVRFYNKATTPTVGTDIPIVVVAIPATSSKEFNYTPAVRFGTGIGVSITGGAAAADATAVAGGDVQLLVSFA